MKKFEPSSTTLNKEVIVTFLRKQKTFLQQEFGVTQIALFGSYAKDCAHEQSDVDFLIEMKVHDFKKRLHLKEFLEKAFDRRVEIGYLRSVRPFLMRSIQKDLIYA